MPHAIRNRLVENEAMKAEDAEPGAQFIGALWIYLYPNDSVYVCPECAHEWPMNDAAVQADPATRVYRDSAGNVLQDGDHDIDCTVDGFGAMSLKSAFVRKA